MPTFRPTPEQQILLPGGLFRPQVAAESGISFSKAIDPDDLPCVWPPQPSNSPPSPRSWPPPGTSSTLLTLLVDALRARTVGLAAGLDAGAAPKTSLSMGPPPPVEPGDPRARPCPFRPLTAPSARSSVTRLRREYLRRITVGVPVGGVQSSMLSVYIFYITFTCAVGLLATVVRRSEGFRRIP